MFKFSLWLICSLWFGSSHASAGSTGFPLPSGVRCTTHERPALEAFETFCSDGTEMVHRFSKTLRSWETTIRMPGVAARQCRTHSPDGRLIVTPNACR